MIIEQLFASIYKVIAGWLIALVLGFAAGILRSLLPQAIQRNFLFNFVLDLIKFPPPIAWVPFVIIFLGVTDFSAILIVVIGGFPPVFTTVYDLIKSIEQPLQDIAGTFEVGRLKKITYIYLPSKFKGLYSAARISLGMCWMSIIAAEMISSQSGIGYLIQLHRINLEVWYVFGDIVLIAVMGYVMNEILLFFERRHLEKFE